MMRARAAGCVRPMYGLEVAVVVMLTYKLVSNVGNVDEVPTKCQRAYGCISRLIQDFTTTCLSPDI